MASFKQLWVILAFCLAISPVSQAEDQAPLQVVTKRLDYYNLHDLEKFLAVYDENVEIYEYPDKFLGTGREHLRKIFAPLFSQKSVSVKAGTQVVYDHYVISDETVTYGTTKVRNIAIYKIIEGVIVSVRLMETD